MSRREQDIESLRREYRALRAPARLAGRIRAHLRDEPQRTPVLPAPAFAALAGAVAVATLVAALQWRHGDVDGTTVQPTSLTVLSLAAKNRPDGSVPGLSSVRGMTLPPLPSRPTEDPGSGALEGNELENLRNQSRNDEEKHHANS